MIKFDLFPNEQLLWEGKPETFRLLDRCIIPALLKDIFVSVLGGLVIFVECWLFNGARPENNYLFVIVLLLVCVPVVRVLLDAHILRRTKYYATDRRLLVVNKKVSDVEYSRISRAALRKDQEGHISLLCGDKAIDGTEASYRERAVVGLDAMIADDAPTPCDSFAFYAVAQPENLARVLNGKLELA